MKSLFTSAPAKPGRTPRGERDKLPPRTPPIASVSARAPGTTAAMIQLGCDKNLVDGERILGELDAGGFKIVGLEGIERRQGAVPRRRDLPASRKKLGLLIVNTCSFIGPAREESIDAILRAAELKKDGKVRRIAVAGCFAKMLHKELSDELREDIDFFIGPGDIPRTLEIVTGQEEAHFRPPARSMEPGPRLLASSTSTAFVRVAEGCNKTCTFCTIPSIRGKFVSREPRLILDEIRALLECGVKEIVLVSQDTANYGQDIGDHGPADCRTLAGLIRRISALDVAPFRLRVHYLYPSQVSDDFIDAMAESAYAAPYFDMPIQHSSPAVLRAMRRPPNPGAITRLVEKIRSRFAESAIRTTVIAGHPGETARDFDGLLKFIEKTEFDRLGVFPFSPEPGTPAFDMPRPSNHLAAGRAERVMELQAEISERLLARRVGKVYDVLMDTGREGRSVFEAPDVDGVIHVEGPAGTLVRARIVSSDAHDLYAQAV